MTPLLHEHRNPNIERLLPEQICRTFEMVPFSLSDNILTIAIADGGNTLATAVAPHLTNYAVVFVEADRDEIISTIDKAFAVAGTLPDAPTVDTVPSAAADDAPMRTGELLISLGLVSEADVDEALIEQHRTGSRLGEILVANGKVSEQELLAVLSEQFEMQRVDLTDYNPDPAVAEIIPEPLAAALHCVPVAKEGNTLYLAVAEALDDESVEAVRQYTDMDLHELLTTKNSIDELLQRVYGEMYVEEAKTALLKANPQNSAYQVLSNGQKVFFLILLLVLIVCLVLFTMNTLIILIALSSIFYLSVSLYKFKLVYKALGHQYETDISQEELDALDERDLPVYTILVPLYREAAVVPRLVRGIGSLDYPKTKLDVKLLCEEDDDETVPAIKALSLPPHFKLVVVPDSQPKTKPKACNYGLFQADGKYIVIYDAEDRPDPDQLKKAVIAFDKADPTVTCIQAKLNYFNQDQNLLTRWFATEYSMHFDLVLPGLDAENVPIPLGGTSNHFITERLRELGAWDPFNVTEDADLGIRLHKEGYSTSVMDSTTLEEANSDVGNWIRQRSRWIKGYIQTYLVHMRNPLTLLREVGLKNFISFNLVVGGAFVFLMNPIFWGLTTIFLFTQAGFIQELFPSFIFYVAAAMLFIGNFVFVYLNVAGSLQRGYFELTKWALLSPLYWGLMSWAAWKGFIQLFTGKAFYWEKTVHGLDAGEGDEH